MFPATALEAKNALAAVASLLQLPPDTPPAAIPETLAAFLAQTEAKSPASDAPTAAVVYHHPAAAVDTAPAEKDTDGSLAAMLRRELGISDAADVRQGLARALGRLREFDQRIPLLRATLLNEIA